MPSLLIFGASTRAAAYSAIRSGFDPICGDMYADADLQAVATLLSVPEYPRGLAAAGRHLPPLPWIYTGALENFPSDVGRVSQQHTLWGNPAATLQRSRDPWYCRDILQQAGLPTLDLRTSASPPPRDAHWLQKPLRSSAGRAITVWTADTLALLEPHYFQSLACGTSIAAVFLATAHSTELLGISEQLIGRPELNAPPFGYCGSLFPWQASTPAVETLVRQMGTVISQACGLRGLFGIDLITDGQTAWLLEVNPRYTASMELIEYARQIPLIDWQRRACTETGPPLIPPYSSATVEQYCGKVILYADHPARAIDLLAEIPRRITLSELPVLADIPNAGTDIITGQPVFTCLGTNSNPLKLLTNLTSRAHQLWAQFES